MHDPQNERDCRSCGEPTHNRILCDACKADDGDQKYDQEKDDAQ